MVTREKRQPASVTLHSPFILQVTTRNMSCVRKISKLRLTVLGKMKEKRQVSHRGKQIQEVQSLLDEGKCTTSSISQAMIPIIPDHQNRIVGLERCDAQVLV